MILFTRNMISFISHLFQFLNNEKVTKSKITIHYLGRMYKYVFNMYFTNLMDI